MSRATLTGRGRAFAAAGAVLVLAGSVLGYEDVTRVGMLLLTLLVCVYLLSRRRPPALSATRSVHPEVVQNGAPAAVRLLLSNESRRRTRLMLAEEQVSYALGDRPRFAVPGLERGAGRAVDYIVRSERRGHHQLGPLMARASDPFGLTAAEGVIAGAKEVIVLPRIADLSGSQPPGSGAGAEGEIPQIIALHGEEDVSIRSYRDGDDLRKVHWPATAHRGELMVRQEDRPARRSCVVVLDPAFPRDHAGSAAFEWAVSAAASICVRMSQLGYVLRLATTETLQTEQVLRDLDPEEALITLAGVAQGSDTDARGVFASAHDQLRLGGVVVAILGDRPEGAYEVAGLRQPGAAGMAIVVDVHSFRGQNLEVGERAADRAVAPLATAGWRTGVADSSTTVRQVWTELSRRSLVRVGSL